MPISNSIPKTRETKIRRDAWGHWFDGDDPIEHAKLSASFDGWIERAPDGRLCIKNNINWAYASIEGPPYFVRSVCAQNPSEASDVSDPSYGQSLALHLSGGRTELLDPTTLRQGVDGALYCSVLPSRLAARFDNHAMGQLAPWVDEDSDGVFLKLGNEKFRAVVLEDPLGCEP